MDVKTGEIKEFKNETELEKAMRTGDWVKLHKRPNPGCKRCHGRGYTGIDTVTKKYVLCRCVERRPVKGE